MIDPRDILFLSCLRKYGTLSRRVAPISRGGEDVKETFTRSGPAAYFTDRAGVLRKATSHVPRVTYVDPLASGTRDPYWLLEDTRTNTILQSQTFGTTWVPTRSSISPDADAGPDGTTTADRHIEDNTASATHPLIQGFTITANGSATLSVYAKAGTRSWIVLDLEEAASGSNGARCYFNLGTGAIGTASAFGSGTLINSRMEAAANGWYRCLLAGTCQGGITGAAIRIGLATGDGVSSYSGNGTGYVSLWGAQVEKGVVVASSYIPTTTTSLARVAEVASFPFYAPPQTMTVYARFVERGNLTDAAVVRRIINIGSSTNPRLFIGNIGGTGFYGASHVTSAGTVTSQLAAGAPTYGQLCELRVTLASTGAVQLNQSINLGAETSATASGVLALGTAWSAAKIYPNSDETANVTGFAGLDTLGVIRGAPSLTDLRALRA